MHQVTETTFRDLVNRSIAFTHKAIAWAKEIGPFDFLDLSHELGSSTTHPFRLVTATLYRFADDGYSPLCLRSADGTDVGSHRVDEYGYRYSTDGQALTLNLPYFALNHEQGLRDLLTLLTPTARKCSYAVNAAVRLEHGMLAAQVRNFEGQYFYANCAPEAALAEGVIPELMIRATNLCCYPIEGYSHIADRAGTIDTPLWHLREQARFAYQAYDPLPDAVLSALDPEKIKHLYPHLPVKPGNTGQIAYTQSATAGVMDRQAVMRAGRFIRQFARLETNDETVKQLAAVVTAHLDHQFKHSREREDYKRVYIDGPSSCMSYDDSGKEFSRLKVDGAFVHPCEVYAHPDNDLELVWCELGGNIIARTIVNKKRMQYPRVYAKESVARAQQRMEQYLEDLGYHRHDHALSDQKLLRISPTAYPRAIICPYIDVHNLGVEIEDDHLIVGGGYTANHETGCLSSYDTARGNYWECVCCGDDYDEDDDRHHDYDGDPVCVSCIDDYVRAYCTASEESAWVHEDNSDLYNLDYVTRGPLREHERIYFNGRRSAEYQMGEHDLVLLNDSFYDSYTLALRDDCVSHSDGDYILIVDLGDHDLFYNEDEGEACPIEDWAICLDEDDEPELVERSDIDDDLHELTPHKTDSQYPMLPVYTLIAQEEAA